jgi:hypothetical protein
MWSECYKFFVISDCAENFRNGFPTEGTENTSPYARSFYPANSLNVLKKALYAFDARPLYLLHISEAG